MLEKILQEIESLACEIRRIFPDTSPIRSGYESAIDDVEDIIRSHMEDDGWIPCSERMPDIMQPVLVCDKQGNVCIRAITCKIKGKKYWSQYKRDVIAWRPLPAPYRPKGEN